MYGYGHVGMFWAYKIYFLGIIFVLHENWKQNRSESLKGNPLSPWGYGDVMFSRWQQQVHCMDFKADFSALQEQGRRWAVLAGYQCSKYCSAGTFRLSVRVRVGGGWSELLCWAGRGATAAIGATSVLMLLCYHGAWLTEDSKLFRF